MSRYTPAVAQQQKEYRKRNWDKVKAKMYEYRRTHKDQINAWNRIRWQEQRVRHILENRELYTIYPNGKVIKNRPKLEREEVKRRSRLSNARWQRTDKGRESHNRAAREYARRKALERKQLKQTT